MKVCFFRHSLLSRGGDKMVVEYANYLASRGHDVTIMTNVVDTLFSVVAKVVSASRSRKGKLGSIVKALFLKSTADVIIADIIAMVFLLSFRNRNKLLYFAQDYDEAYYKNALAKLIIRTAYLHCLRILRIPVIAVSEELGQLLRKRFNADVRVVPNGIDTNVFRVDIDEEYLFLKGSSKVILVFARSDYRKGFDIAISILKGYKKEIEDGIISIWAVGENIGAPFTIRNFGFVPPEKLRKILSCSNALLYPSRHEGLPLFVLEAMACGCPVVTSGTVSFIIDGENGMIAETVSEFGEKLIDVLTNDRKREHIIHEGFATIKGYDLHNSKRSFENILKETFKS